jgi:hypothetical protein
MEVLAQHAGGLENKRARTDEERENLEALDHKLREVAEHDSSDGGEVRGFKPKSAGRKAASISDVSSK